MRTLPPRRLDRLLVHQPVAVGHGYWPGADDPIRGERAGHLRLEDVELLLGDVGEGAFGHAEVLREDLFRDVGQKVRDQEGQILVEGAVVEDEQELATVPLQSLERVRDAAREVPDVALADIVLEGVPVLVDGGDPHLALEHEPPLVRNVPVHLPDRAGLEPHVDAVKRLGNLQLSSGHLPSPAAGLQPIVDVGK